MIDQPTLNVLRALARGTDPATGEALPAGHVCQQTETVRALGIVVAELEAAASGLRSLRNRALGAKAGTPWDPADDEALARAYDRGESLHRLAQEFQRSRGAIEARLVRLGKIEAAPGMRFLGMPARGVPKPPE